MKPFKKTILHVGPDKTGSTSIQITCNTHRNLLLQHGVYYPLGQWHAQLGSCFCDFPERYIFNSQAGYNDCAWIKDRDISCLESLYLELGQVSGNVLVFSYEGFVDLDIAALMRFKSFIGQYSDHCEVVFYARSPFSYAVSAMSQRVKSGIHSWPDNDPPISPTRDFLEKLCEVFGKENLNVRKFSRDALPQGDVVLDFLALLNLPDDVSIQLSSQANQENTALSAEAILFGDKMLEILSGRTSNTAFGELFGCILSRIKGGKVVLNSQQISELVHASQGHLDYLAKNFGIIFKPYPEESISQKSLIASDTLESLANVIIELVMPDIKPQREFNSPLLSIHSAKMRHGCSVTNGQLLIFDVDFYVDREIVELEAGIHIFDGQGRWAFGSNSTLQQKAFMNIPRGTHRISHYLIADLPAGRYTAGFAFAEILPEGGQTELAWYDRLCEFQVYFAEQSASVGYAQLSSEISLSRLMNVD